MNSCFIILKKNHLTGYPLNLSLRLKGMKLDLLMTAAPSEEKKQSRLKKFHLLQRSTQRIKSNKGAHANQVISSEAWRVHQKDIYIYI